MEVIGVPVRQEHVLDICQREWSGKVRGRGTAVDQQDVIDESCARSSAAALRALRRA
jgi:hypothetical protein